MVITVNRCNRRHRGGGLQARAAAADQLLEFRALVLSVCIASDEAETEVIYTNCRVAEAVAGLGMTCADRLIAST